MQDTAGPYLLQVGVPVLICIGLVVAGTAWAAIRALRDESDGRRADGASADGSFGWAIGLVLLTVVFLAANQLLVRGAAAGIWDADSQFFPWFVLVADHARALRFVTWDPWTNGGLPALGDPQIGAFSPIVNLFGLVFGGTSAGFRAYWLFAWWLGGVGILLLGRHLRAPVAGAFVVALGFLFCGVYTGNAEHTSWVSAFSFLPFTVWRLDEALRSGRLHPAVEAGAIWGLSALAGHPAVIIVTGCYCALWVAGRVLFGERAGGSPAARSFRHGIASLAVLVVVGSVVLSPAYVSYIREGAGTQPRTGALERDVALSDQLDPGAIATLADPYLTTLKVEAPALWPSSDVSMVNVYAGPLIPLLVLLALALRNGGRWRWWLGGLGVLMLASALGESLPVRGWWYDLLPPMRYIRPSSASISSLRSRSSP
jgi:hypothetical protein